MDIREKLTQDLNETQRELADAENRCAQLRWKLQYISTLLQSDEDSEVDVVAVPRRPSGPPLFGHDPSRFTGLTVPEVIRQILLEEGAPLRMKDIAERAIEGGFGSGKWTVSKLIPNFSSMISKDNKRRAGGGRFVRVDRGMYDLAERHH